MSAELRTLALLAVASRLLADEDVGERRVRAWIAREVAGDEDAWSERAALADLVEDALEVEPARAVDRRLAALGCIAAAAGALGDAIDGEAE